jgi:hypothetical protein
MDIFENIDFNRFFSSLTYMWQGMLCIFVVIGVLILTVLLLGKLTAGRNNTD